MNETIFGDIPNVTIYIDDIIVATKTEKEHSETIEAIIKRAIENNVKFNPDKLQYKVKEVNFLGHRISEKGIATDNERMKAIQALTPPNSKTDLQKLLGFVNYVREYIPNLSQLSAPLRELLKKDVSFQWLTKHERCLLQIKEAVTKAPTLSVLNVHDKISIQTDASKYGLGSCLIQRNKPICFASRSLTEAEQNYSQTEKEYLAVVFACYKWHTLIYGRNVEIITDHKPLLGIASKEYCKIPSPRFQRMKLKLEKYNLSFTYRPGKEMFIADLLSRNFTNNQNEEPEIQGLNELVHSVNISPKRKKQFQEETEKDITLWQLKQIIKEGWPEEKKKVPDNIKYFWKHRDDLFVEDNLVFFNDRIFVPTNLRPEILKLLHDSHFGIEKTRQRARSLVYWPNLNEDIEKMIANCNICQKYRNSCPKEPLLNHEIPENPFQKIGLDIMELSGKYYLVLGDYLSKYLDIIPLPNKKASSVINKLEVVFSIHGIPNQIVADNNPFNAYEFNKFAEKMDIEILPTSPHYPRSNGFAERCVQIAKQIIRKCKEDNSSIWMALLEYRNTPIKNSNISPTQILMGRQTRTLLPAKSNIHRNPNHCQKITPIIDQNNRANKRYYDRNTTEKEDFKKGEKVWLRDQLKKWWVPAEIVDKHTSPRSYFVKCGDKVLRRNSYFLRKCRSTEL